VGLDRRVVGTGDQLDRQLCGMPAHLNLAMSQTNSPNAVKNAVLVHGAFADAAQPWKKPASFAKSQPENLPCIGFPPQIRRRIELISGNPVDLEFDCGRRFGIDEAHALEFLRAHR